MTVSDDHVYLPRHPHDTQVEAAEEVLPSTSRQRAKVEQYIDSCGDDGATDTEIQEALDLRPNSERPRRRELVQDGDVCDSGLRRAALDTGRSSIVWIINRKAAPVATFNDPAPQGVAGPPPPKWAMRGPEHADNYRIKVGRYRDRWYRDPLPADDQWTSTGNDESYPSVSIVKGASGKDWSYTTLKRIAHAPDLEDIAKTGFFERYAKFKVINELDLKAAQRRGTNVHTWAEHIAYKLPQTLDPKGEGGAWFPVVDRLFADLNPELVAAEMVCIDRTLNGVGYGGTSDGIYRIDGKLYMVDWKSRGEDSDHDCYPEEAGQIGGYVGADYMIVADDDLSNPHGAKRIAVPKLDGGLIISIKTDSYEVYPIDLDKAVAHFYAMHGWWVARRTENHISGAKWAPRRATTLQMAQERMEKDAERETARRLSAEGGEPNPEDIKLFELRWELGLTKPGRAWVSRIVAEADEAKASFRLSDYNSQRRADIYCALTEWATTDDFDWNNDEPFLAAVFLAVTASGEEGADNSGSVGEIVGRLTTKQAAHLRAVVTQIAVQPDGETASTAEGSTA